jgi:hypothetical protein
MGQFLRDQKLHNLKIDEAALDQLNNAFVARAHAANVAAGGNQAERVLPYYVLRFDEAGYRFVAYADIRQRFVDARDVERLVFVMDSGADRQSGGLLGTRFDLVLDAKDPNGSMLRVTSDSGIWVDETFAAVTDVLSRHRHTGSAIVRTQWTAAAIQLLGVCLAFMFSLWAASVIAPRVTLENAFAVTLIFALLIFSNIWTYLLTQIARFIDFAFPNIRFVRKDKEGKGNWLLRGAFIGVVIAPISLWLITQLFALAAHILNTYIVR